MYSIFVDRVLLSVESGVGTGRQSYYQREIIIHMFKCGITNRLNSKVEEDG
jgi:hypothetical protein